MELNNYQFIWEIMFYILRAFKCFNSVITLVEVKNQISVNIGNLFIRCGNHSSEKCALS